MMVITGAAVHILAVLVYNGVANGSSVAKITEDILLNIKDEFKFISSAGGMHFMGTDGKVSPVDDDAN